MHMVRIYIVPANSDPLPHSRERGVDSFIKLENLTSPSLDNFEQCPTWKLIVPTWVHGGG